MSHGTHDSYCVDRRSVSVSLFNFSIKLSSAHERSRSILWPVTCTIAGGSLFAILGGSGSGKTTLLNVIAGRFDKKAYKVQGDLLFDNSTSKCGIGYVTQNDYLLPFLTVRETVLFAAKMRISATECLRRTGSKLDSLAQSYRYIVDEVLLDLGLKECADTRVGDSAGQMHGRRGISGGEKRRVSIAVQIISDPQGIAIKKSTDITLLQ